MAHTEILDVMQSRLGIQELPGRKHNPIILGWAKDAGHPEITDDETSWCSLCMSSAALEAGYPMPPPNMNTMARSWTTWGVNVALEDIKPGDVAVWPRGNPKGPYGHVNVVKDVRVHRGKIEVKCIGGNQGGLRGGDAVTESAWRDASQALKFRRGVRPTIKALRKAGSTEIKHADMLEAAAAVASGLGTATAAAHEAVKAVPDTVAIPSLDGAAEHINSLQAVMEALNGMANVVLYNPWLAAIFIGSLAVFWVARLWKQGRLNRHNLGYALSSQAERDTDA